MHKEMEFTQQNKKTTRRPFFVQSFCFFVQKLLGEDNVQGQLGCLTCEHMHRPWNHYNKSWLFKRFNLIKLYALTKRMFVFTKGMGHERHMVFLVSFFS